MPKKLIFLFYWLIFSLIAFFVLKLFTQVLSLQITLAFLTGLVWAYSLRKVLRYYEIYRIKQSLLSFCQTASSRLSMGQSLNRSLSDALDTLVKNPSFKGDRKALHRAKQGLSLHHDFSQNIPLLLEVFPCPEAHAFFGLIHEPQWMGQRIPEVFKRFERSVRMNLSQEESLRADQSKNLVEALSLLFMPVLICFFMSKTSPDFMNLAFASFVGRVLLLGAYLLFSLSVFFIQKTFFPVPDSFKAKNKEQSRIEKSAKSKKTKTEHKRLSLRNDAIRNYLEKKQVLILPFWTEKIEEAMAFYSHRENKPIEKIRLEVNLRRMLALFLGLLVSAVFFIKKVPLFLTLTLPVLFWFYPDYRMVDSYRLLNADQILALPNLFHYLALCLSSGMSLSYAFSEVLSNLPPDNPLLPEVRYFNSQLKNQVSQATALEDFSKHINFPEASMYLQLLDAHTMAGSKESLQLMELQDQHLQHVLAEEKRKAIASKANAYLLPLVMNLLAVISISLAPILPYFSLA